MKKSLLISFATIITMIIFSSCGGNEPAPKGIEYPTKGKFGKNILNRAKKVKFTEDAYSLAANVNNGKIMIQIKSLDGSLWHTADSSSTNWSIAPIVYSDTTYTSQAFVSIASTAKCDLGIRFEMGEYAIEYYEYGDQIPVRVDTLSQYYDLVNSIIY